MLGSTEMASSQRNGKGSFGGHRADCPPLNPTHGYSQTPPLQDDLQFPPLGSEPSKKPTPSPPFVKKELDPPPQTLAPHSPPPPPDPHKSTYCPVQTEADLASSSSHQKVSWHSQNVMHNRRQQTRCLQSTYCQVETEVDLVSSSSHQKGSWHSQNVMHNRRQQTRCLHVDAMNKNPDSIDDRSKRENFPSERAKASNWESYGSSHRQANVDAQHFKSSWEQEDPFSCLSKLLSRILRHQAIELKLRIRGDGYVDVKEVLRLNMRTSAGRPLSTYTIKDIMQVVKEDQKQRFGTMFEEGQLFIRANQGHTIKSVETEKLLQPITAAEELPVCVHGTYFDYIKSITRKGLNRMRRNHIHFASGMPNSGGVISGARASCELFIHLDVEKALKDGLKLFRSSNGVILTEGFNGIVPPEYFWKIETWPDRKPYHFQNTSRKREV